MNSAQTERTIARMKSYVLPAVFVLFLYTLGWVPGFVVNLLYYSDARRMERIAGERLPGSGCLLILLWLNTILVLVWLCAVLGMILYWGVSWYIDSNNLYCAWLGVGCF